MHVEPMKLMLKAPGTKRLNLKYDEPPSKIAFKINLRRYCEGPEPRAGGLLRVGDLPGWAVQIDPIKPMLKPPGTKRLKLNCDVLLSTFAFKLYLRRYIQAGIQPVLARQGLPVCARHVIGCRSTRETWDIKVLDDVASDIWQALYGGGRTWRRRWARWWRSARQGHPKP